MHVHVHQYCFRADGGLHSVHLTKSHAEHSELWSAGHGKQPLRPSLQKSFQELQLWKADVLSCIIALLPLEV